jgi:hypothetical protein
VRGALNPDGKRSTRVPDFAMSRTGNHRVRLPSGWNATKL